MTVWVLHCWWPSRPAGEVVSWHPTLDAAVDDALAYIEADCAVGSWLRSVYSICEARNALVPLPSSRR